MTQLIAVNDLNRGQCEELFDLADKLQGRKSKDGFLPAYLRGRHLMMIFDETSLRTRTAFETAMLDLGGHAHFNRGEEIRFGRKARKHEHLGDLINVIGEFHDALLARVYDHEVIKKICEHAKVPVINGMCDRHHPTQALCDVLTMRRHFGRVEGLKVAFLGDGNNVALSLAQACSLLGAEFHIATPAGFELNVNDTQKLPDFHSTTNPEAAVRGADVVITDAWVPMNRSEEKEKRHQLMKPYQVTSQLLSLAHPQAIFMHCLPATRGEEVHADVIDGHQSLVYKEAASRLHVARAILLMMLEPDWRNVV